MTSDKTKAAYIDYIVKAHPDSGVHIKSEYEANNNNDGTPCANNLEQKIPCSTNGEMRNDLRNTELRIPNNGDLRLPSEFSIEYWNSSSGLGLSIEKDEPNMWESTLLEDMNFFNTKMPHDMDQHPESSTRESHDATASDSNMIYTTLTSLSNDPSSPSISLDEASAHSTSTPNSWYLPPSSANTNSPTISTTSIASSNNIAEGMSEHGGTESKVPNIEDLDSFLNIIPAGQNYVSAPGFSEGSYEWKQEQGDTGGNNLCEASNNLCEASNLCESNNLCEQSNIWKQPSEDDSLLRNALQGKSFKYANPSSNNEFVLAIKDETPLSNIVLDNSNISTIIYPIDSNSSQSIDEILQNINTHYETSVDEFNNNTTGEYNKVNGANGESIEIYYAIDNNLNVNYVPNSISSTGSAVKKKKKKSASLNNNNELINGKKERSLHYCEICNKGFKDKYSVNVHVRTHTGEKPFPCKICCKTFRQKAHLAKHFQTHLAPTTHPSKAVCSSNKIKIMKT